jgi:hypothetical protein
MSVDRLVSDLLGQLQEYPPRGDRAALLRLLQQWLKSHLASWSAPLRERWKLDRLAAMDLARLPIEESSLVPDEEVDQLRSVRPTSMEIFAMRLRDIFWAGTTVESDVVCPRCGDAQLRVLVDAASEAIVLSCDICAWSQTSDGKAWKGASPLQPALALQIHEWQRAKR